MKNQKKYLKSLKLVNQIQKIRSKNNKNWMDLLKLSLKYGKLCYGIDLKTYGGSSRSLQNYWNSKRSLYWHYMWLHFNRFDKLFLEIYKTFF